MKQELEPAGVFGHDLALFDVKGMRAGANARVCLLGCEDLWPRRSLAERLEADDTTAFTHRGNIGDDPIKSAVTAAIFYHALPGSAGLERFPEVGEGLFGHIGMTHDIVGLSDQISDGIPADFGENLVGFGDDSLQIGSRINEGIVGDDGFDVRDVDLRSHLNLCSSGPAKQTLLTVAWTVSWTRAIDPAPLAYRHSRMER